MRISIQTDNGSKEVELKPKKKHRNEFLEIAGQIQEKGETPELAKELLEVQDRIIVDCSNLNSEEFDDLDLEEQNKLTKELRNLLFPFGDSIKKN